MDPRSQVRFAELLRYFQRGTFPTFTRAAELAFGGSAVAEPYFVVNLLLASQICGLCETSVATGTTQWWAAHDGDIRINSRSAKVIGATDLWLTDSSLQACPLVANDANRPLVFGSLVVQDTQAPPSLFDRPLPEIVPTFRSVEHQLCKEVSMTDTHAGPIDVFNPAVGRWEPAPPTRLEGAVMFRVREPFFGFSYYLQHTQLSLRFQVLQPEWAFVTALHLLPWNFSNLAQVSTSSVHLPRAVRLPSIIYRSLFASAESVRIGPIVRFQGLRPNCVAGLTNYFDKTQGNL